MEGVPLYIPDCPSHRTSFSENLRASFLKLGPDRLTRYVGNYQSTLRNIQEHRRSEHFLTEHPFS
jgi:hypothetical protein